MWPFSRLNFGLSACQHCGALLESSLKWPVTTSLLRHGAWNQSTSLESTLLSRCLPALSGWTHSPLARTLPATWPEMTAAWPWLLSGATRLYACAPGWPQSLHSCRRRTGVVGDSSVPPLTLGTAQGLQCVWVSWGALCSFPLPGAVT